MRRWRWFSGVRGSAFGVRTEDPTPSPEPRTPNPERPAAKAATGRPGWWRPEGQGELGMLYPDEALDGLLEEMRRTVPVLDRAITVLVQLAGEPPSPLAPPPPASRA